MIKVENISFEYPGTRALNEVSFEITPGNITALVGPNGAGKTTLMRCLAALDTPFSGSITINGIDALEQPRQVHRIVGYLSDFFGLYSELTVRQSLIFIAKIHQIAEDSIVAKVALAVERLGLEPYIDTPASALSRGWRQRLGIAQALIHEPRILLLDEPASGLDPEARMQLSKLFLALKAQGMTLMISSHILAELEDYCTDMLMLQHGRVVEHCQTNTPQPNQQQQEVLITCNEPVANYLAIIQTYPEVIAMKADGNALICSVEGDHQALQQLLRKLIHDSVPVYSFAVQSQRLQDIYMGNLRHATT